MSRFLTWLLGPPAEKHGGHAPASAPVPQTSGRIPEPPVPSAPRTQVPPAAEPAGSCLTEQWHAVPHMDGGFTIATDSGCEVARFVSGRNARHIEWLHNHWAAVEGAMSRQPPRRVDWRAP